MRTCLQTLLLAFGLLAAPVVSAGEPLTLESVQAVFNHSRAGENSVCVLHDGWHLAFLSHNGKDIGAVIIIEQENSGEHQYDLPDTISRVAGLVGMDTPESMDFDEEDYECSLLVDQAVLGALAEEADHAFSGSPLEALAYLIHDEYFCIHNIRQNGFIHWKTIKKSQVELLMPIAEKKLSAIEVTGRQEMNDFAAEVLADKLGLGRNNVPPASRQALCPQLRCILVPYMNTRNNVLLARTDRRTVIGKRAAVAKLLANRNEGSLNFADQPAEWPETREEVEEEEPETTQEAEQPETPLTPEAAREAYIKRIQCL